MMKLRLFEVNAAGLLGAVPMAPPSSTWVGDGPVRWLHVEGAPDPLLARLLAPLGIGPVLLARYKAPLSASEVEERNGCIVLTHPQPSDPSSPEWKIHFACVDNVLVSFAPRIDRDFDEWFDRWLDGSPMASDSVASLLRRIMEAIGQADAVAYFALRKQTHEFSERLKQPGESFEQHELESALKAVDRINSFFFDQQRLYTALQGAGSQAFSAGPEAERFRAAALRAGGFKEGVGQLQRRLENIQQQHMLGLQAVTDRNLRVLTVLSAVFLPLTLISGIYGMNFVNMPELNVTYGYPFALSAMGLVAMGMLGFFYWRGWFR